ncbi:protein FAM177B [Pelobates fuscus]|uniref:protein FAM177B n=1 Tax=Pelobates fuscus TaxID=191477 RepID=UPI002FE48714
MSDHDIALKELEDVEKHRVPRRIIHFASGETIEEYSTEEEEEDEEEHVDFKSVDTTQMTWGTYTKFWVLRVATYVFFTCDFLGGKLASLFGLNAPKYQYAIDEYNRMQDESDDEDGEDVTDQKPDNALNEKHIIMSQSVEYGTIQNQETSTHPGDILQLTADSKHSDRPL